MKFNQLRDFVAVAEAGSLRGAARALGLAQPAITRSIQELEHQLGAQLFIRGARGVRLTPAGETFHIRARNILEEVRRSREEVMQIQGESEGSLVIGLSIAGHMGVLQRVLRQFIDRYPRIHLRIIEGFLPTLEGNLLNGSMDFYIGPVPDEEVATDLHAEKLFDNERLVIARPGHSLANAKTLAELAEADWLTTSITHEVVEELRETFALHRLPPPRLRGQCQSALSILTVLSGTDMLCMAPRQWVESPLTQDLLIPIRVKEIFPAPPIMLVHRKGLGLTPAAEYFAALVRRAAVPGFRAPGKA